MAERKSYLTPEDVWKIVESADTERNRLILTILASTGMRVSELTAIRVQDIDFEGGTTLIPHLKSREKRNRSIFLDPRVLKELQAYIHEQHIPPTRQVFPLSRQMIYYITRTAAERAGIVGPVLSYPGWQEHHYISPHRFRDAIGTNWSIKAQNMEDIRVLQEVLGHARTETTLKYFKLSGSNVRKAYSKFMLEYKPGE